MAENKDVAVIQQLISDVAKGDEHCRQLVKDAERLKKIHDEVAADTAEKRAQLLNLGVTIK